MKIACVTDDGQTISAHFGRAQYYAVLTVAEGQIVARELRPKIGHSQFGHTQHVDDQGRSGTGADSHSKHVSMAAVIDDCEALLCRGMGYGAYQSMEQVGIKPVVTDIGEVDAAALAYAAGTLIDHTELLH
ncbi:MAG: dinitrogenase iron-molybdenum cofactor biosynthesis protein [Chloroflexi bacterium]|jgi:predicted Fe-Mo cluster-binding NifX family protein|nr:dinitrogenase iron-molybdenum cofactor biosynthesis protein [Chloroflexota bacterium]